MNLHDALLAPHIAAAAAALALGPAIMLVTKRRGPHTRLGETYHWLFFVVFISAVALAVLNWDEVWFLAPVGAFSYGWALLGYVAAKRRRSGWLPLHVAGQGGSYIALLTPFLIVNWESFTGAPGLESPLAWLAPTVIGSPVIAYVVNQVQLGRRPKRRHAGAGARARIGVAE